MRRSVSAFLLLSLLLHLAGLLVFELSWEREMDTRRFRARLARQPRFVPPSRFRVAGPVRPAAEMEYLQPEAQAAGALQSADEYQMAGAPSTQGVPVPALRTPAPVSPKADTPQLARESMPSPSGSPRIAEPESEAMELLRLEDMARADRDRAVVIVDPRSRRDIRGYINFTYLRMAGICSYGDPSLEALARYLRDHTGILARTRGVFKQYFHSEELLKDPIHFMYPMPADEAGMGGARPTEELADEEVYRYATNGDQLPVRLPDPATLPFMSRRELRLLGRYLRGGGFLYVQDPGGWSRELSQGSPWLRQMIRLVYAALEGEGRLIELPFSHPLYTSFYQFADGFPSEERLGDPLQAPPPAWYYRRGVKDRPGLWGLEVDGALAVIFSDTTLGVIPMTNVVVYALTRPGGLTPHRQAPAWTVRPPEEPVAPDTGRWVAADTGQLLQSLAATLAVVQAPIGSRVESAGLRVTVDPDLQVETLQPDVNGVLIRNLPAGPTWIRVEHGGAARTLQVDLSGGRVTTVTYRMDRLLFVRRLRVQALAQGVPLDAWRAGFPELELAEIFHEPDSAWLDGLEP